jgi:amino acid transporter
MVGRIQLLMVILLLGSVALLAAGSFLKPGTELSNLTPLFAPGKAPLVSILSILAISTWAFAGFDTIPQASEEFGFSPKKAFRLIVLAILFGALMYVVVSLSTAVAFPWQDLMAQKPVWATGSSMKSSMGDAGTLVLLVGVLMAMFTGLNGFYLATSRLLFSMGRAKVLPPWFAKVHPKHKTPSNAIIFTLLISLFAPWFGRQVIIWILDMSAVGTGLAYAYTCMAAFLLSRTMPEERRRITHVVGFLFALCFLVLLCVPGMPAFMAPPSWIAMAVWVTMGITFYSLQARQYRHLSGGELDYLILGKKAQK